jgi:16S rRNA (adenine1518-N6/adenine1519-N6)-dimethyltransferase
LTVLLPKKLAKDMEEGEEGKREKREKFDISSSTPPHNSQPLTSPSTVRSLLDRYNLRPDKAFGQNFLIDVHALSHIVEAAQISSEDTVLEIGPGLGVLTRELATRAKHVTTVELDKRLLPALEETLKDSSNLSLIHGDGLTFDFTTIPIGSLLVANLPYNVGTAILVRSLEASRFKRLVFLVQKEVAERLTATPGTKSYGALSLVVKYFGTAKRLTDVKPSSFFPAPEVTSSVVRIDINTTIQSNPALFDFIHTTFRHRRKTLKKNLTMAGFEGTQVAVILDQLGLTPDIRAEALSLENFQQLWASTGKNSTINGSADLNHLKQRNLTVAKNTKDGL